MNIRLKTTKVSALSIEKDSNIKDGDFDFSYSQGYESGSSKEFFIRFESIICLDKGIKLDITFDAKFECNEDVSDEFKNSHFPKVNAPAIAFPYLRTFISNLSLNSGYDTIILPAINFQALEKKISAENEER